MKKFFRSKVLSKKIPQQSVDDSLKGYEPLLSEQHFRLLRLEPGQYDDPLVGTLEVHHIDDCPNYTAVSYEWGLERTPHTISVNSFGTPGTRSMSIPVRLVLHHFLRSLRQPEYDRLLFVDAICINQQSNDERSDQVKLMGRIFQTANKVEASLDAVSSRKQLNDDATTKEHVKNAFSCMKALSTHQVPAGGGVAAIYHKLPLTPYADYFNSPLRTVNQLASWSKRLKASDMEYDMYDLWESLARFCELPYWRRRWIIQEIIVARTVVLHFDGDTCPMKVVEDFFENITNNPYSDFSPATIMLRQGWSTGFWDHRILSSTASNLARHRICRRTGGDVPTTLLELLPRYTGSQCSVVADQIYALFNLLGEHRQYLTVDYKCSPLMGLHNVLVFMLEHEDVSQTTAAGWTILLTTLLVRQRVKLEWLPGELNTHIANCVCMITAPDALLLEEESLISAIARRNASPISGLPEIMLFPDRALVVRSKPRYTTTNPQDQIFFRVDKTEVYGLADHCRPNDYLRQIYGTDLIVVCRDTTHGETQLVGRAMLFTPKIVQDQGHLSRWEMHKSVIDNLDHAYMDPEAYTLSVRSMMVLAQLSLELSNPQSHGLLNHSS